MSILNTIYQRPRSSSNFTIPDVRSVIGYNYDVDSAAADVYDNGPSVADYPYPTAATDSTVSARISGGLGRSLMVWGSYAGKGTITGAANVALVVRRSGEIFTTEYLVGAVATGGGQTNQGFDGLSFPALSDIKMRTNGSTTNIQLGAGFDLLLV